MIEALRNAYRAQVGCRVFVTAVIALLFCCPIDDFSGPSNLWGDYQLNCKKTERHYEACGVGKPFLLTHKCKCGRRRATDRLSPISAAAFSCFSNVAPLLFNVC